MALHVVVQGPVEHDGLSYQDGAEIDLADDVAAPLVAAGVASLVEPAPSVRKKKAAAEPQE